MKNSHFILFALIKGYKNKVSELTQTYELRQIQRIIQMCKKAGLSVCLHRAVIHKQTPPPMEDLALASSSYY